ncbi:hypothetical protein BDW69DRAFT_66133 [Aspergillus filifer]
MVSRNHQDNGLSESGGLRIWVRDIGVEGRTFSSFHFQLLPRALPFLPITQLTYLSLLLFIASVVTSQLTAISTCLLSMLCCSIYFQFVFLSLFSGCVSRYCHLRISCCALGEENGRKQRSCFLCYL